MVLVARFVVIDDGSGDGTAAEAVRAGARVITLPFNLGIGTAVQTGYLIAQDSGYDIAIQVDGDGQHPPSEIPALVAALQSGEADLVIGSRFLVPGTFRSTRSRRLGIGVLARLVSMAVRQRITDSTSGFRAAGPRAISLFAAAYPHDYPGGRIGRGRPPGRPVHPRDTRPDARTMGGRSSITPLRSGLLHDQGQHGDRNGAPAPSRETAGGAQLTRIVFVSLVGAVALSLVVLELVRRRRLQERYSMLWLATCLVLIVLAVVPGPAGLDFVGGRHRVPTNALFIAAFGFVLLVLLNFSIACPA